MGHSSLLIRELSRPEDLPAIVDIWLDASILAHDFISAEFWNGQVANMRDLYLPSANIYLAIVNQQVLGFYAVNNGKLEALFVTPERQGQGIGTALLNHAKQMFGALTLSVYQKNVKSYEFYQERGFSNIGEETDKNTEELAWVMASLINKNK